MKKIILILMLSLTALVAIDFTMTKQGLFTETNMQPTPEPVSSPEAELSSAPTPAPTTESIATDADISNIQTGNISYNSVKVTWDGNPNAQTWVYVHEPYNTTGSKHNATDNQFTYSSLGAGITFTVYAQGVESDVILKKNFTTKQDSISPVLSSQPSLALSLTPKPSSQSSMTPASKPSSYLEPIDLPKCDANNTEVQFIRSNADWKMINSSSKRIFCVSPGDYRSLGQINLKVSGTAEKRRYIVLNNGNDLHPAQLSPSKRANFAFILEGADYWVIDRCSAFDVTYPYYTFRLNKGSSHNIINRMYTSNTVNPFWIRKNSNYNTIQNSMFDGKSFANYNSELGGVLMEDWDDNTYILGNKFINNEFINMNGIRLGDKESRNNYFDGTIIDGNLQEYNENIRCDCGAAKTLNPDGDCMFTEAVFVSCKGGSSSASAPIIISNNVSYGGRKSRSIGEIGHGGNTVNAYMGADFLHIYNNVFFDSTGGISIADAYGQPWGTQGAKIYDNILIDCGDYTGNSLKAPLRMYDAKDGNIQNNLIINPVGAYWAKVGNNVSGSVFGNNDIVNIGSSTFKSGGGGWSSPSNNFYNTTTEAGYTKDFTFTKYKFTNNPETVTIPNVLKPN